MSILIEEEAWRNSQLSIARFYGGIKIDGTEYKVMQPFNDLIDVDFIKYYSRLGRNVFIDIINRLNDKSKPYIKGYLDMQLQRNHVKRKIVEPTQMSLW